MNFAVFVSDDAVALREIAEGCREYRIGGQISVVIGSSGEGRALQLARDERIPAYDFSDDGRSVMFHEISELLELYRADILIITDHRCKLSEKILSEYKGRIFYIVPSTNSEYIASSLQEFRIYEDLLSAEETSSAISIFRLDGTDGTTLVAQKPIRVYAMDTPETLAERIKFFKAEFVGDWLKKFTELT